VSVDWIYAVMAVVAAADFCLIAAGVRFPIPVWQFAGLSGFVLGASLEHLVGRL
jgi:hypothetical protein